MSFTIVQSGTMPPRKLSTSLRQELINFVNSCEPGIEFVIPDSYLKLFEENPRGHEDTLTLYKCNSSLYQGLNKSSGGKRIELYMVEGRLHARVIAIKKRPGAQKKAGIPELQAAGLAS